MPGGVSTPVRVLGVDPGLHITGYGVLEMIGKRIRLIEAGVVKSRAETLEGRVRDIFTGVREVIEKAEPGSLALEALYSHYKRPMTAVLMGHARGAICLAAALSGLPVISYPSTAVKKTLTGHGRAPKDQIQRAIQYELGLKSYPNPPDVADALAIALCHIYTFM
ncbi:MAG: crossover junction endodeoxyribonuclease RuvC [Thermoguttaceae bacterium]|nr:crossover junction endodeoxyribonuclease RuvC [Thermoguttaceae bacterium]